MEDADVPTELDERLLRGLDLFDAGEHFEAHEALEDLWSGEVGAARRLLQALIQLAVALHHRGNGNLGGARALLDRALEHLAAAAAPAGPGAQQPLRLLDARALEAAARALRDEVRRAEAGGAAPFDPALVPRFDAVRAAIRAERRARGLPAA